MDRGLVSRARGCHEVCRLTPKGPDAVSADLEDLQRLSSRPGLHGAHCTECNYLFDAYETPSRIKDVIISSGYSLAWHRAAIGEGSRIKNRGRCPLRNPPFQL